MSILDPKLDTYKKQIIDYLKRVEANNNDLWRRYDKSNAKRYKENTVYLEIAIRCLQDVRDEDFYT